METFIVAIVRKDSIFANETSLDLVDLKNEKYATLNIKTKINSLFLNWCDDLSFKPNLIHEGVQASEVCGIVRSNSDIIGILPDYYSLTFDSKHLRFIPLSIDNIRPKVNIYLASNKDNFMPPHVYNFGNYFIRHLK